MMKKILFITTLILLFTAYNELHYFISNSVYGIINADGSLSQSDIHRGWDAILAAWPIALTGALLLAVPSSIGLAALYMLASKADNHALITKVDDQLANARAAVARAREDAEKAVESRAQAALLSQQYADNLMIKAEQIKSEAAKQIAEMAEKIADANAKQCRAAESFQRIKRKNERLEAGIAALNSTSAAQTLKNLGLLNDNQTAQEDEKI